MVDIQLKSINDIWVVKREIGFGTFSRVYEVSNTTTGVSAAAKVFSQGINFSAERMKLEGEILSSLSHKNIISFLQYCDSAILKYSDGSIGRGAVLFTEYGSQGDFGSLLERAGPLPEDAARTYLRQVVECIEFLHEQKLCHFDIKPENMVIDEDYNLKLCDFGCSMPFTTIDSFKGIVGTNNYLAPEAFLEQFYSGKKIDVFSCGVMLFVMVTGHYPFDTATRDDNLYRLICERKYSKFWAVHQEKSQKADRQLELSEELKDLIIKMLKKYPSDRITLDSIKHHSWFKGSMIRSDELCDIFSSLITSQN